MTSVDIHRRLYELLAAFREGRLDTTAFCDQFEQTYNLDVDKKVLSSTETEAFGTLFEKVIWYSPYPDERKQIPNYVGEDEIREAADAAARILKL